MAGDRDLDSFGDRFLSSPGIWLPNVAKVSRASRGSGLVLTATKKLEASADLLSTV
jgi:hypothetical protein